MVDPIHTLFAGLTACQEDEPTAPVSEAQVSVLLNGERWQPQEVRAGNAPCFPDRLGLVMDYYNEAGLLRQGFSMQNFPLELGKHPIYRARFNQEDCFSDHIWSSYDTLTDDGDVLNDFYQVVEQADNHLIITAYDSLTQALEGTFQATLAI